MLRIATAALACTFAFAAGASHHEGTTTGTTTATTTGMTKADCGKVLREKSAMMMKAAEFMTSMADTMDAHVASLGKTKEAKMEATAIKKHAKAHRDIAKVMTKEADMMAKENTPAAEHGQPDQKWTDLMTKTNTLQKELATMMNRDAEQMDAMMKGTGSGSN
jgi:hypothetical protein